MSEKGERKESNWSDARAAKNFLKPKASRGTRVDKTEDLFLQYGYLITCKPYSKGLLLSVPPPVLGRAALAPLFPLVCCMGVHPGIEERYFATVMSAGRAKPGSRPGADWLFPVSDRVRIAILYCEPDPGSPKSQHRSS